MKSTYKVMGWHVYADSWQGALIAYARIKFYEARDWLIGRKPFTLTRRHFK